MGSHSPLPWELFTGSSWKRIRTSDYKDIVIEPTIASDGHQDMIISEDNWEFIKLATHTYYKSKDRIKQLEEALKAMMEQFKHESDYAMLTSAYQQAEQVLKGGQQ